MHVPSFLTCCIGSLEKDNMFDKLLILGKPCLLYKALYFRLKKSTLSWASQSSSKGPCQNPCHGLCCVLGGCYDRDNSDRAEADTWVCFGLVGLVVWRLFVFFYTKYKAPQYGREAEPLHRWDLCATVCHRRFIWGFSDAARK